jgi:hypothetical protein
MIHDVDETLRRLLSEELAKRAANAPAGSSASAGLDNVEVSFSTPEDAEKSATERPRINLYLHDVRENVAYRDESFALDRRPGEASAGRKRAAVRLNLAYLITAHAGGELAREHQLLAEVLGILFRNPAAPPAYFGGELEGLGANSVNLAVAQPDGEGGINPASVWQSLGGKARPVLGLVVTAPFDPFETKWTKVVREALLGVGQGTNQDGSRRGMELGGVRVSIAGVVVDGGTSAPISNVQIGIEGRRETAISDEKGFFHFLGIAPGRHTLHFQAIGFEPHQSAVTAPPPGRTDLLEPQIVTLTALPGKPMSSGEISPELAGLAARGIVEVSRLARQSVAGTLLLADGNPAAYIPVRVNAPGTGTQRTITDGRGAYCFFNLPTGDVEIVAEVPNRGDVALKSVPDGPAILTGDLQSLPPAAPFLFGGDASSDAISPPDKNGAKGGRLALAKEK